MESALIIQPFIENAIWHGIVPKGKEGHVELSVGKENDLIEIIKYNQFIDFVYDKKKASMGLNKREAILGPVLMKNKTLNLQNNLQNLLKVFPCR